MGRARFAIGDVVYLFMSDERCVRFKMVVTAENCKREDQAYWVETPPNDIISLSYSKKMMVQNFLNKSCTNMVSKEGERLRFLIAITQN
jgi:hypothetical protein